MDYAQLPSISELLSLPSLQQLEHVFAVNVARTCVNDVRRLIASGQKVEVDDWNDRVLQTLRQLKKPRYQSVINATGIVIHTNLGRAPMGDDVLHYVSSISSGYCDLELQLSSGKRGGRLDGIRRLLKELTGAPDSLVVNNNAAATMLSLSAIASGKEVLVSRGELVEIGGSFRIPDVVSTGGATLVEVGTTNRTRVQDYERAITENTGAILRVHPSNYRIVGFTERASRKGLAALAKQRGVPLIDDVGSGLLDKAPNVPWKEELERDESIRIALEEGADLVCFSGDKLLGGPQAGLVVGRRDLVERCQQHPLYRALRVDKMVLAALEKTLQYYREGREDHLPVWAMLQRTAEECKERAQKIATQIAGAVVERDESFSGGGALPNRSLDTYVVVLRAQRNRWLAEQLRKGDRPVMVRLTKDSLRIDPRTCSSEEGEYIAQRINMLLRQKEVK